MVKNLSGKTFSAFDSQHYAADFTPTKKPDETRKLTDEITENVDERNGKTTKNQRKGTLKHCRKCGIVRANGMRRKEGERIREIVSRFLGWVAASFLSCLHFRPWFGKRQNLVTFSEIAAKNLPYYIWLVPVPCHVGSGSHGTGRKGSGLVGWSGPLVTLVRFGFLFRSCVVLPWLVWIFLEKF